MVNFSAPFHNIILVQHSPQGHRSKWYAPINLLTSVGKMVTVDGSSGIMMVAVVTVMGLRLGLLRMDWQKHAQIIRTRVVPS